MPALMLYSPWGALPAPDFDPADIPFLPLSPANDDGCARTCRNWVDGRCEVCGASYDGYSVAPSYRCPSYVSRSV